MAEDIIAETNQDTAVGITLVGSDVEICELAFSVVNGPDNGSLSPITDQECAEGDPNTDSALVTYTPFDGFVGQNSFTYVINDGSNDSNEATVSIAVVDCGNLNDDSFRNILDVVIGLQIAAAIIVPTPAQLTAGDLDHNQVLDVADVNMNLEHIIGLNEAIVCG